MIAWQQTPSSDILGGSATSSIHSMNEGDLGRMMGMMEGKRGRNEGRIGLDDGKRLNILKIDIEPPIDFGANTPYKRIVMVAAAVKKLKN